MAKNVLWGFSGSDHPRQKTFPLEPVAVFVGDDKLTSCMHKTLQFWIHKQIEMDTFFQLGLISAQNFQEIAWRQVHDALLETPRMFQVWVCKQVTNIAGVNGNQVRYKKEQDLVCPSCDVEDKTCSHVLFCREESSR